MSDLQENLRTEFQEPEYRYGYAESFLNTKLATQIKTLREEREKTQAEAAALMGIKQPGYRRFEDVNHPVWRSDTLWNIARAYGVRVDISFKSFGSLLDDKERFNKEDLKVPAFEDDPAFKTQQAPKEEPKQKEAVLAAANPPAQDSPPEEKIFGLGTFYPAAQQKIIDALMENVRRFESYKRRTESFRDFNLRQLARLGKADESTTSAPAPIDTRQSVPNISQPSRPKMIENPLTKKAAA